MNTKKNIFKLVKSNDGVDIYKNEATGLELWASPEALTVRDAHWTPVGEVEGWRYGRPSAHPDHDAHRLYTTLVVEWYYT